MQTNRVVGHRLPQYLLITAFAVNVDTYLFYSLSHYWFLSSVSPRAAKGVKRASSCQTGVGRQRRLLPLRSEEKESEHGVISEQRCVPGICSTDCNLCDFLMPLPRIQIRQSLHRVERFWPSKRNVARAKRKSSPSKFRRTHRKRTVRHWVLLRSIFDVLNISDIMISNPIEILFINQRKFYELLKIPCTSPDLAWNKSQIRSQSAEDFPMSDICQVENDLWYDHYSELYSIWLQEQYCG